MLSFWDLFAESMSRTTSLPGGSRILTLQRQNWVAGDRRTGNSLLPLLLPPLFSHLPWLCGPPAPPPPPAAPCSPQTGAGAGFKGTHSGRGAWGGRCKLVSWALGRSHSPSAWPAGERRASSQGDPPLCSCHLEYLQLKQKTNKL